MSGGQGGLMKHFLSDMYSWRITAAKAIERCDTRIRGSTLRATEVVIIEGLLDGGRRMTRPGRRRIRHKRVFIFGMFKRVGWERK